MLVLGRRVEEAILLDGGRIRISVLDVQGGRVKLGIEAPREVGVQRENVAAGQQRRVPMQGELVM